MKDITTTATMCYNFIFPETVNNLIPNLWIANKNIDSKFITDNNIDIIVNCTPYLYFPYNLPDNIHKVRIPVKDSGLEKDFITMQSYLTLLTPFLLKKYTKGSRILVFCRAGAQRSAIVCAVLLKLLLDNKIIDLPYCTYTTPFDQFNEIVNFIVSKRPRAFFYGFKVNFKLTYMRFFKITN